MTFSFTEIHFERVQIHDHNQRKNTTCLDFPTIVDFSDRYIAILLKIKKINE